MLTKMSRSRSLQLGHDVLTVHEAGHANQRITDRDVLAFAITVGRAVLTINRRDFVRLHHQQPIHHGIVACTENVDTLAQAQRIHAAISGITSLDGKLIRVTRSVH
jgi:hypothetical protein